MFQERKEQGLLTEHNKEKLKCHEIIGECVSEAKAFKLITKGPAGISKEEIWEQ